MTELRCEMCGQAAKQTPLGSLLCSGCRALYREFHCVRCGQRVMYLEECAGDRLELADGVCSACHMRERGEWPRGGRLGGHSRGYQPRRAPYSEDGKGTARVVFPRGNGNGSVVAR